MSVLIIIVIFGLAIAYFATQNTTGVTIRLAQYTWTQVPLYIVTVGSLLIGVFIAWIISLVDVISSTLTIHGKESAIKEAKKTIADLTKQVHHLELENTQLKAEMHKSCLSFEDESSDENAL